MSLDLAAYLIYLGISVFIIGYVGLICYRNGNVYVAELIPDHPELCKRINYSLLIGYYLVNIGYAVFTLAGQQHIQNIAQLFEVLSVRTAIIISILAVLHYINLFVLTRYLRKFIH